MKRILIGALTTAMVLSPGVTGASAYGWRHASGTGACGYGCHYVDADGDGLCDCHGSSCPYMDAGGDGVCDYHGSSCPYMDADGDGACDYRGSSCPYANTTESSVTGYAVGLGHHGGRWG